MTTEIYLAKYVPDPARWEPRNIGVIVRADGSVGCRFLGEKTSGAIDGRSIRHSVGAPVDVYREWVRFWRRSIVEERQDPASLRARPEATFFVQAAGEVWLDDRPDASIEGLVGEYFRRLVADEEPPGALELKVEVERLLAETGMLARAGFKRDVVIESSGNVARHRERLRFPYAFENGHRLVGHRVPLGIETLVHDALYRYLNLPQDVRAISFVHGFDEVVGSPAAANLAALSTVIDVATPAAAAELDRLVPA
ncbi:MAG: hypothetical protein IVW53_10155 [Chloroflexi bacterium]|nr:hypothetical protein [Chloroflexota bacterium]